MRAVTHWTFDAELRPLDALRLSKRTFDVLIALVLLLCLVPLLLVCALAVLLDSPGPVLYRQTRIGQRGRAFEMLKFRSMHVTADARRHHEYAVAFVRGTAAFQGGGDHALFKLANDDRVTRVGNFLRRTSLDELPQLWNVLRGEMSLVGPRPPVPYEVECYQPHHCQRLSVRPGITGLWQVQGRSRTSFEEMVAMDCEYIRRQSLALDLRILLQTIPVVLLCKGGR